MRRPGPDFIVIGAMKCGTSTLHEQLAAQDGFFMSEPKEPNFFSDDDVYGRGLDWYRGLFAGAGPNELRGESSTHYTKLPTHPAAVARCVEALGTDLRLVYVMRHPVDRLVSHYVHAWTENEVRAPIDEVALTHPGLVDYGRYAMQLKPWLDAVGAARVLPVFFERLAARPQEELTRVCEFLGHRGSPRWIDEQGRKNASSERMRKSPLRDAALDNAPVRWLRRTLVPRAVRDRVKSLWMMRDRPKLSETVRRRVELVFDEDLAVLGARMGVALSCASFRDVALGRQGSWTDVPTPASR